MPNQPKYIDYTDKIVESILKNESLSDDDKISSIAEYYKNLLLQGGSSSESVKRNEKEIRESIIYQRVKIENAFKSYNFYNNESVLNSALAPIRLMEEALSHALVFIITNVKAEVRPEEQHVFNEAKRLGWTVDQTKQHQEELLKQANKFSKLTKYGSLFGIGFAVGFILMIQIPFTALWINGSFSDTRNVPDINVVLAILGLVLVIISSPAYFLFLYDLFSLWFGKRKSLRQTQDLEGRSGNLYRINLIIGFFPIALAVFTLLIIYLGSGIGEEKIEKERVIKEEKAIIESTCKLKIQNQHQNRIAFFKDQKEVSERKASLFLTDGTVIINLKNQMTNRILREQDSMSSALDKLSGDTHITLVYTKIIVKSNNREGWINNQNLICY